MYNNHKCKLMVKKIFVTIQCSVCHLTQNDKCSCYDEEELIEECVICEHLRNKLRVIERFLCNVKDVTIISKLNCLVNQYKSCIRTEPKLIIN